MLTEPKVRGAKPGAKPYKLTDERGLYLLIAPAGGKLWRFDYRHAGKRKTLALGAYPDVSLAMARERRKEARRLLAEGVNPSVRRRAEKADERAAARATSQHAETAYSIRNDGALSIHLDRRRIDLTPAETAELRAFLAASEAVSARARKC
jgi:hypothetical protein